MSNALIPHSLDDYFQSTPIGSVDKAIGNNLYGINHRQISGLVPTNKDTYGLTFFTRPQLNLQNDNLRNVRQLSPMLSTNMLTIQQFVRCQLDPRIINGYSFKEYKVPPRACPMVDNKNAFISILTNNLNSISGWPDIVAPTFTSKPGLYNEAWSIVDGVSHYYETFDMDASFRNTRGDPILYMFYVWLRYSTFVFEGKMMPYIDFITENEIDYNTRIYRLVLDQQKNKVRKIAATGAAFPVSVPTGSFFDYTNEKPYNDQNKDITIRFRCMGVDYQDDILIEEFNKAVTIFNSDMVDGEREKTMVKLNKNLITMFNNRGYPRIDKITNELEWWVDSDLFHNRTQTFLDANLITEEQLNSGDA